MAKFKVGDKVRVIAANNYQDERLVGNTYKVTFVQDNGEWYELEDPEHFAWHDDDLELVKPKFDIGDYSNQYVMHVTTEEQDKIFRDYLHSIGKKWSAGQSYKKETYYDLYKGDTCYLFAKGEYCFTAFYKDLGFTILEFEDFDWSDFTMKKEFTKKDLKNGDVVMKRDGAIEIVCVDTGTLICTDGVNALDNIENDLTSNIDRTYDIIAVRRPHHSADCRFKAFEYKRGELVYERKEVEEMTLEEVCKALGKDIKIVKEK